MAGLSVLFGLLSLLVKPPGSIINSELLILGLLFAAIYCIGMIREISRTKEVGLREKMLWLVMAIAFPIVGAIIYRLTHQREKKALTW